MVKLSQIEMVHKKKKNDKEARVASIMVSITDDFTSVLCRCNNNCVEIIVDKQDCPSTVYILLLQNTFVNVIVIVYLFLLLLPNILLPTIRSLSKFPRQ